jgi:hypothetical protein
MVVVRPRVRGRPALRQRQDRYRHLDQPHPPGRRGYRRCWIPFPALTVNDSGPRASAECAVRCAVRLRRELPRLVRATLLPAQRLPRPRWGHKLGEGDVGCWDHIGRDRGFDRRRRRRHRTRGKRGRHDGFRSRERAGGEFLSSKSTLLTSGRRRLVRRHRSAGRWWPGHTFRLGLGRLAVAPTVQPPPSRTSAYPLRRCVAAGLTGTAAANECHVPLASWNPTSASYRPPDARRTNAERVRSPSSIC